MDALARFIIVDAEVLTTITAKIITRVIIVRRVSCLSLTYRINAPKYSFLDPSTDPNCPSFILPEKLIASRSECPLMLSSCQDTCSSEAGSEGTLRNKPEPALRARIASTRRRDATKEADLSGISANLSREGPSKLLLRYTKTDATLSPGTGLNETNLR
jgi:hypothetical protein